MKPPDESLMIAQLLPVLVVSSNEPSTLIIRKPSAGFFQVLFIFVDGLVASAYSLRNGIRSRSGLQRLQRKGSRPSRSIVFWTGLPCIIAQQTAKIAQHGELNRRPPASSASGHAALANGPSRRCCLQCTRYRIYYGQTWKNYP